MAGILIIYHSPMRPEKVKNIKSYTINTTFKKRGNIKNIQNKHQKGCKVDPPPSGAPWATSLTAKWSTTLA